MVARSRGSRPRRGAGEGEVVEGVVIRLNARHAVVRTGPGTLRCTLRKSLFHEERTGTKPVAVGDHVRARTWGGRDGVIESVDPRRNCLARALPSTGRQQVMVANVDLVVITISLREPDFRPRLIDRLLVAVEREDLKALLAFTKVDLVEDRSEYTAYATLYEELGYPVLFLSAETGEGMDRLAEALRDRTTVFAGHSGVGKSTLLNALQPGLQLKTASVSGKWNKGRHTTTAVSLLPLDGGGYVVDTPGIRTFGIAGMEAWEIGHCFPEIREASRGCHFPTCSHTHEPDCAVKEACERGTLDVRRFESYLRIIEGEDDLLFDDDEEDVEDDA